MAIPSHPVADRAPAAAPGPFDDYRLPIPIRVANKVLAPVADRWWPVQPDALRRRSRASARLDDFGDVAPLDEPLEVLCRSINSESDLTPAGRLAVRQNLLRLMKVRLRLVDLMKRRPELADVPVTAPLFIAGMPRSGTTFLHRTMARDHAWYTIPLWEMLDPLPPEKPRGSGEDPRRKAGERALRTALRASPAIADIHEMDNDEPDEELPLLTAGHASATLGSGHYPSYTRWYTGADHTGGYRLLRQFVQALQAQRPAGGRWLFKSPSHLENLGPLLTVFDDATVVLTHRDPVASIVSLAALDLFAYGILLRRPDPHYHGRMCVDFIERCLRSMVAFRDSAEGRRHAGRFVDIAFDELVGDPVPTMLKAAAAAGHAPDDRALEKMTEYAGKPSGHRSRKRFTVEDFGLDKEELRERFAFYYQRFDVPIEKD